MLRTERPSARVLEAAALLSLRSPNLERHYSNSTLEAASKRYRGGGIGLAELIIEAAWANGYSGHATRVDAEVMRAAFSVQAGGFSTIDMGGILSNIANKSILDAFMAVDQAWRQISAVAPVSDFKPTTRYRMTGANQYEAVGKGGDLKHGTLGEESFVNQAHTYGKLLAISRHDVINDDLGAFAQATKLLGRGAALKLNEVFWTEFLDNASFFTTGNANWYAHADSVLSIDSLSVMEQRFLDQVDADGMPIGIMPAILLVPTSLSAKAAALMSSAELRDTTANTKAPVGNPHAGKFRTVVTPYLSNATLPGYSATAWYLLANPADLAVIETVFLDGKEAPTIETAAADFSALGIQLRGFHDFGVAKQDHRAGAKSKGAA